MFLLHVHEFQGGLGAAVDVQLLVNLLQVPAHGFDGDAEVFTVGAATPTVAYWKGDKGVNWSDTLVVS